MDEPVKVRLMGPQARCELLLAWMREQGVLVDVHGPVANHRGNLVRFYATAQLPPETDQP